MSNVYGSLSGSVRQFKITDERTKEGRQITEIIAVNWNEKDLYIKNYGDDAPIDYNFTRSICVSSKAEKERGEHALITNIYQSLDGAWGNASLPDDYFEEQASSEEIDIRLHPSFSGSVTASFDFTNNSWKSGSAHFGIEKYKAPALTVTTHQHYFSLPASQVNNIGKCQKPEVGSWTGAATNWLIIDASRQIGGGYYKMVKTHVYSPKGFASPWYTTVT